MSSPIHWTCPSCEENLLQVEDIYVCLSCQNSWAEEELEHAHSLPITVRQKYAATVQCFLEDTRRGLMRRVLGFDSSKQQSNPRAGRARVTFGGCEKAEVKVDFKLWRHLRTKAALISASFLRTLISKNISEKISKSA